MHRMATSCMCWQSCSPVGCRSCLLQSSRLDSVPRQFSSDRNMGPVPTATVPLSSTSAPARGTSHLPCGLREVCCLSIFVQRAFLKHMPLIPAPYLNCGFKAMHKVFSVQALAHAIIMSCPLQVCCTVWTKIVVDSTHTFSGEPTQS